MMMYILAGVGAIVIFTLLVIITTVCLVRKKPNIISELNSEQFHPAGSLRGSMYSGFSIDDFGDSNMKSNKVSGDQKESRSTFPAKPLDNDTIERSSKDKNSIYEINYSEKLMFEIPDYNSAPLYAIPLPKSERINRTDDNEINKLAEECDSPVCRIDVLDTSQPEDSIRTLDLVNSISITGSENERKRRNCTQV